ncbi:MAG: hypothetical protein MZV70_35930 [Desulfobacterales bacterium]|nr:hypothetical protein [Desulfobacterales bacterium]
MPLCSNGRRRVSADGIHVPGERPGHHPAELGKTLAGGQQPKAGERFVMVQCVGSREEPNKYCSRICCQDAIKNAIAISEKSPKPRRDPLQRCPDIRPAGRIIQARP